MPAKKIDSEPVEIVTPLETTAVDPSAEPAAQESAAPSEAIGTTETTETVAPAPTLSELAVALSAAGMSLLTDPTPPEPEMIECVTLHGRLTHEGKTYSPGEPVLLPADLARGLIDTGHVAKKE